MLKRYLSILLVAITGVSVSVLPSKFSKLFPSNEEAWEEEVPLQDRMDLAWELEHEKTMDPQTGDVPKERLITAWKYMRQIQGFPKGKAAVSGVQWTSRGPNNNGGRSRCVLIDRNDPTGKKVWVGSVAGGLWYTTDITQASPNWTPINDFMDNLAISSITQSKVNPQVMYFSTGESYSNSDATRGLGLWKSTDGGATWNPLAATQNSNFYYCYRVLCPSHPDTVFVCTQAGLYRTLDGGSTFTKVLGTGISSATGNYAYDIDVAANGVLYASMASTSTGSGTVHKSYNKGTTWTNPLSLPSSLTRKRIEIGLCENDTNTLYCVFENNSTISAIVKSTDAGVTWAATSAYPADADSGIPSNDISRTQAWYDISVAVDPNNAQRVFVGGVDLFKTENGGSSWTQTTHWYGGFSLQYMHADQHLAMFAPGSSSTAYFTNDGGIFQSTNANTASPTITDKGTNYTALQFYSVAIHPTQANYFLAGAQDNGSHRFNTAGMNATSQVTGGDGAFCHIDQDQPNYQFTSYVYCNYYASTNGGSSFTSQLSSNNGRFINPSDYDNTGNMMYMANTTGTYLRWSDPQTGSTTTSVTVSAIGAYTVSAVTVSPNVANRIYLGAYGKIYKVDSANIGTSRTAVNISSASFPSAAYLNCIEVENGNENHIIVCFTNYGVTSIWETTNGGTSWVSIEGNLPDMPIRWATMNPAKPYQVFIATELGVWSCDSLKGANSVWGPCNTGLANVRVEMLQVRKTDGLLAAATHGRGLFTATIPNYTNLNLASADFSCDKAYTYPGAAIAFVNNSVGDTSYAWTFGDNTSSTLKNPTKSYANPGVYTVTLSINNGKSTKTKTGFINILPYRGTPYTLANGGDFESNFNDFISDSSSGGTPFQRGNSTITGKSGVVSGANAWVLGLNVSNYLDLGQAYLYTPCYNMSATGTYTMSFYLKNSFEIGYDGIRVEYTTNKGTTWQILGNVVQTSWYDFANNSGQTAFTLNEAFFNAANSSYALKSYNMSALAGNANVGFRFVFKSDELTNDAGCAIDNFSISGPSNNALPLHWLSVEGKTDNQGQVEITWKTTSEYNTQNFDIERKVGSEDFQKVGNVPAKNRASGVNTYSFSETLQELSAYYRIRQNDKDGQFSYSPIVRIRRTERFVYGIYADASSHRIRWVNPSGNMLHYRLIALNGATRRDGNESNTISYDGLETGIYILELRNDAGQKQTERILLSE